MSAAQAVDPKHHAHHQHHRHGSKHHEVQENSDEEDINLLFIKHKPTNRCWLFMNCILEVAFVALLFAVLNGQLYTTEALKMRQELGIRFDLQRPDYVNGQVSGFVQLRNFTEFYDWMNATLLARLHMDPYYQSLTEKDPNWASRLSDITQGVQNRRRRLEKRAGDDNFTDYDSETSLKPENTSEYKPEAVVSRNARASTAMQQLLERRRTFLNEAIRLHEVKKQTHSQEDPGRINKEQEHQDSVKKIRESIEELETIIRDANRLYRPKDPITSPQIGARFVQSRNFGQSPAHHISRLLQATVTVSNTLAQPQLYFPQYFSQLKAPLMFNKLISTIHIKSRLRLQRKISENLPDILTQNVDTGQSTDMKYPYVSSEEAYVYDFNIFGKSLGQSRQELKEVLLTNQLINNRSFELEVSFGMLNSNTYMLTNVWLYLRLSSTGYFQTHYNLTTFRFDPYIYSRDKARNFGEYVLALILLIIVAREVLAMIISVQDVKIYYFKPQRNDMSSTRYAVACILKLVRVYILKVLFGFLKYISTFNTFMSFSGIILNLIMYIYWLELNTKIGKMHKINYSNLGDTASLADVAVTVNLAANTVITFRKVAGLMTGIYCLRLVTVVFAFFERLQYFWISLVNALSSNLYFLFFLFMINLGVSLFTHFYFGGQIDQFSTMFKSFIVVFATILGYTDGISQMLDAEPLIATIALEVYYFLVIMILINMFIVFVNAEYKKLEDRRLLEETYANKTRSPFDYTPNLITHLKEQWNNLVSYKVFQVLRPKKFKELQYERKLTRRRKRLQDKAFSAVNWDMSFQRFVDIDFGTNNSLGTITKISSTEIEELLRFKQFRYYWKFIGLMLWMLLHLLIIFVIYAPLESDYSTLFARTQILLKESSKSSVKSTNGILTPVPYSDLYMRTFTSELFSYWYSKSMATSRPAKVFQAYYQSSALKPVTDYLVQFQNVELKEQSYSSHNVHTIAKYRYLDYSKGDDSKSTPIQGLTSDARNFSLVFNLPDEDNPYAAYSPPNFEYTYDSATKSVYTQINSSVLLSDPYFIKLVGDNVLGPETNYLSVKTVFFNSETNFYILLETKIVRNIGDMYDIFFYYNQINKSNLITSHLFVFPIAMILKFVILVFMIHSSYKRIRGSYFEYNIWYKIGISNELPAYLIGHRNRKEPEWMRKIVAIVTVDDVLLWLSSIFYLTFLVSAFVSFASMNSFIIQADNCINNKQLSYDTYSKGENVASHRFQMNFFAGFEVLIITIQVLISLRRLKMFKVILEAFKIIVSNLFTLIIIMTMLILSFSLMINVLLGDKYDYFVNALHIHKLTGILISFKRLIVFTDNFDTFTTIVFMIPYFLIIKYTVLYMIIAVIYSSISVATKIVEERTMYETRYLTVQEFYQRTLTYLGWSLASSGSGFSGGYGSKEDKYSKQNITRYINSLNFSTQNEVFNRLIDSIHFTEGKNDVNSWKKMLGEATIAEFIEREKISNKHQEMIFHLLNFTVNNQKNFFVTIKDEKDNGNDYEVLVRRLLTFYKIFFNYFRYGHNKLMKQISIEYANLESSKKELEQNDIKEQRKNDMKTDIAQLQDKIERMISKSVVYWRLIRMHMQDKEEQQHSEQRTATRRDIRRGSEAVGDFGASRQDNKLNNIAPMILKGDDMEIPED